MVRWGVLGGGVGFYGDGVRWMGLGSWRIGDVPSMRCFGVWWSDPLSLERLIGWPGPQSRTPSTYVHVHLSTLAMRLWSLSI